MTHKLSNQLAVGAAFVLLMSGCGYSPTGAAYCDQNTGVCTSIRNCAKKPPMLAGSTSCNSAFTAFPFATVRQRCRQPVEWI